MEKKVLRIDVGKEKEFNAESYGNTHTDINEVIEFFAKAKEAGATHVDWYAKSDYDGDSEYCQAQPFYEAMETDAEVEARLKKEADYNKKRVAQEQREERLQYERLKAKFG